MNNILLAGTVVSVSISSDDPRCIVAPDKTITFTDTKNEETGITIFTKDGASRYNMNLLENSEAMLQTNGARAPWLPANHPDVLKNILSTVVHEVGHTLGLRHNFIAQEDGNTSVMAYGEADTFVSR